ncbi:DEKNAAC105468 [Brettanomyces naardenensis]|uniref:EKC/KEOPS complex subunit CGI121 n=1 Tax=Brettanomyces naardenensis TaxID=13370 RepID=A0A448YTF1_BRENA|nr:DEKNAAC105468 [Brettanomyces naardenensis]
MTYSTLTLPQFPHYRIFASLYKNVKNHRQIRDGIRSGSISADFDFAFLNAANVLSLEQIYSALFRCFVDKANGKMKANTIHTELISDMSTVKNIMEALTKFGIPSKGDTVDLVVLKVLYSGDEDDSGDGNSFSPDALKKISGQLDSAIENDGAGGCCLTDTELESTADLHKIRKNYKLSDLFSEDRDRLNRLLIGTIQLKGL